MSWPGRVLLMPQMPEVIVALRGTCPDCNGLVLVEDRAQGSRYHHATPACSEWLRVMTELGCSDPKTLEVVAFDEPRKGCPS